MSADFFIITPSNYTIQDFTQRVPQPLYFVAQLEEERFLIRSNKWHGWIERWKDYELCNLGLDDYFSPEQIDQINNFDSAKIFMISASCRATLYEISILIADDGNILMDNDTDALFIPGNEFVAKIRSGEKL